MAALSVALGAGFDFHISMHLANIAAGIAVGKHGTVAVPLEEVLAHPALGNWPIIRQRAATYTRRRDSLRPEHLF